MIISDLTYHKNAGKKYKIRKELALRWAVGICVVTTAASLGVVTGVLIAPKSGKETRTGLRKRAAKSVATIEKAILGKADDAATEK